MPDDGHLIVSLSDDQDMAAWDAYVRLHPAGTAYHLSDWREIIGEVFKKDSFYLMGRHQTTVTGILPLVRLNSALFGNYLVSMPYVNYGGVLADSEDVSHALVSKAIELASDLGVSHVELRHQSDAFALPKRTDKVAMRLKLTGDPDELFSNLGAKRRSQIRRPQKEGATIQSGGAELLPAFYKVFAVKYRDLGIPVYPLRWFQAIFERLSDSVRVFVAKIGDEPVAASIVLCYRDSIEVPWASSLRWADRFGINMFLYWEMLKFAEQNGFRIFDFGRCTKDSGTWRFKRQWGAETEQLYWHYWLPESDQIPQLNAENPRYRLAVSAWRKLPVWATKIIGPHIVKNLP